MLILHFQMRDKGRINVVLQNNGILAFFLEQIDILALLNLVSHIEDGCLFRLFFLGIVLTGLIGILHHINLRCLFLRNQILDSLILAVKILEQQVIHHLFTEFVIL